LKEMVGTRRLELLTSTVPKLIYSILLTTYITATEFFNFGAGSNFCADPKPPRSGVTGNSLANMAGACHPNAPGPQNVVGVMAISRQNPAT
jgi:hypothetical protein